MDKDEFNLLVGQRISYFRKKKGWTQQKLGDALLKDRQEINHIEKGRYGIGLNLAYRIAQALEVSLDALTEFD